MSYNDPYQPQQPQQYPYQQQQPYQQYPSDQYPQDQYPQAQYPGYAGYAPPASSGQTNVMAILSLVFAFVFWPLAIVFGHIAKRQIRERNEQGSGLATAGLVLGYVFGALFLVVCGLWVVAITIAANHSTTY